MAPQAGLEPTTIRLTASSKGFGKSLQPRPFSFVRNGLGHSGSTPDYPRLRAFSTLTLQDSPKARLLVRRLRLFLLLLNAASEKPESGSRPFVVT